MGGADKADQAAVGWPVKVTIRVYAQRDADGTADVFYRSAREVALSNYAVAQVKAWVEASELARRFFERKGFTVKERRPLMSKVIQGCC